MGIKVRQLLCDYSNQVFGSASWGEVSANCQMSEEAGGEEEQTGKEGLLPSTSLGFSISVTKHQCLLSNIQSNPTIWTVQPTSADEKPDVVRLVFFLCRCLIQR